VIDANAPRVAFEAIDSTNTEAMRRANAGDLGPYWLRAGTQTIGRGRRGREWLSAPGNLFLTYLGTTQRSPADTALLSFAAALAVADTADRALGREAALLKWPNDVLIVGRKVSGILLESGTLTDGRLWFAVGIGINVAAAPTSVDQPIASLAEFSGGQPLSADALEPVLRRRLSFWAGMLEREGFAPLRTAWLERAHGLGAPATARLGGEEITGVARGLSADGALELELPDKRTRLISAGEVFFGATAA
jgi:BirA family transcriptional regulator, biotin operon repressor / biotin---[acetyl-CoA-carboxylase] ligase